MSIHEWKVFEFQLTIDLSQTFFGNYFTLEHTFKPISNLIL